ncbi:MAG: hypothetical protein M3R04_06520 [bacterium]|nr:hypothetical protein [bacterium]
MNSREHPAPADSPQRTDAVRSERFQRVVDEGEPDPSGDNGLEGLAPEHLDSIAKAVQALLSTQVRRRLSARLAQWPRVLDDADDICQLAAIAFVEAYREGRITPDVSGLHTARSVSGYVWGICSRIFSNMVRRSRPASLQYVENEQWGRSLDLPPTTGLKTRATEDTFDLLLDGAPGDEDSRLWDVLRSVEGRCAEKDIIVTYLLASGATSAEVRAVLGLSENVPANALRRVGRRIGEILGIGGDA